MTLVIEKIKSWAKSIKCDVITVYFAARNPATPLHLRLFALAIAAYALSPIDLIPDFIPIIGYLDDLLVVPVGIWLIVHYLDAKVLEASRAQAVSVLERPRSIYAAIFIIALWLITILLVYWWVIHAK